MSQKIYVEEIITHLNNISHPFKLLKNDLTGNRMTIIHDNKNNDQLIIEMSPLTFTLLKHPQFEPILNDPIKLIIYADNKMHSFLLENEKLTYYNTHEGKNILDITDIKFTQQLMNFLHFFVNPSVSDKNGIGISRSKVEFKLSDFFYKDEQAELPT